MLEEFKRFITRGNLVDLAVAFIMGLAFAAVVTAFVNVILSIVAAIFGSNVSFDRLNLSLNGTPIPYGALLTAIVSFLIIGFAVPPLETVIRESSHNMSAGHLGNQASQNVVLGCLLDE